MDEIPAPESQPLLERFKYFIFLLLAAALIGGVAVLLLRRPAPTTITVIPPEPTLPPSATATPGPYVIYVTGAVVNPDVVVTLPYGSRVLHAIQAAGGALDSANLERVNLAQLLNDGDQVDVPTRSPNEVYVNNAAPPQIITPTPGSNTVYVTGEVLYPQAVVSLPQGSRVQDAIQAAGGTTGNADLSRVNLSQILNDGDLVYVPPLVGEAIQTPTPNHAPLVHVNSATVEELVLLPGIGPSLAQAIIDYRTQNGPFKSLEDLDNVPGIGPGILERIRDQVVFD